MRLLREHWRCHPAIAGYVSELFYNGELRVRTPIEHSPPVVRGDQRLRGIEWTHIPGGSTSTQGGSRYWQPQIDAIVDELERVADTGFEGSVGVVTPFRSHANRIRDAVASRLTAQQLKAWRFESQTADGFQGDERDLVLLGLVGGPLPSDVPSFYSRDRNRFNVAISRARSLLHVFGDREWAARCGLDPLAKLVDAWSGWQAKQQQPVRSELIGPVWEPKLAGALRTAGFDFHQQYPACGFYLDFAFLTEGFKLAVEVDGETYHRDAQGNLRIEDVRRDQMLSAAGWHVLRFWVYELRDDMENCVARIRDILASA
jgi:very-short-patch-repair endonuclease